MGPDAGVRASTVSLQTGRCVRLLAELGVKTDTDGADLEHLRRVGHRLHCVSPNHEEAAQFYDVADAGQAEPATVERLARQLLEVGCRTVIVRSGAEGAFVLGAGHQQGRWVPAYTRDQNDVVDVTGCGNSFLVRGLCTFSDVPADHPVPPGRLHGRACQRLRRLALGPLRLGLGRSGPHAVRPARHDSRRSALERARRRGSSTTARRHRVAFRVLQSDKYASRFPAALSAKEGRSREAGEGR